MAILKGADVEKAIRQIVGDSDIFPEGPDGEDLDLRFETKGNPSVCKVYRYDDDGKSYCAGRFRLTIQKLQEHRRSSDKKGRGGST